MSLPTLFLSAVLLAGPTPSAGGPTLAIEDTMHTQVQEVLVRAPRVTLDEILDRVARGEARRESLLTDQSFTGSVRLVRLADKKKPEEPVLESAWRIYRKRPDRLRTVLLRRWEAKPPKKGHKGNDFTFDFDPGMGEEIVNFAFQPGARGEWRYHIVGRDLVGNHLIYKIAFDPRSLLDFAPSGLVWVDTNEFVIVREEVSFSRSPIPLLLESIPRMVVERQQIGSNWVLARVMIRMRMVTTFPTVGRAFDLSIHYDDYHLNEGLSDSLFVAGSRR